jgi:F-type H+-transporting ATPase subunit delta
MPMMVANRYARALAEVVKSTGNYRQVLQEMQDFLAAWSISADLREICETPAVPLAEKTKVLEAILQRMEASRVTFNLLRVLLAHYRMRILDEVIQAFQRVAYDQLGIVRVRISSAADLTADQRDGLRARFGELTQKQVELEFHLNPDLVGGLVAQIGSTVYDGSVRGHLRRIREQLMAR